MPTQEVLVFTASLLRAKGEEVFGKSRDLDAWMMIRPRRDDLVLISNPGLHKEYHALYREGSPRR